MEVFYTVFSLLCGVVTLVAVAKALCWAHETDEAAQARDDEELINQNP